MWHAWERRNAFRVLLWKPERKPPLGIYRRRLEDNITTDLKKDGQPWTGFAWIMIRTSGGLL